MAVRLRRRPVCDRRHILFAEPACHRSWNCAACILWGPDQRKSTCVLDTAFSRAFAQPGKFDFAPANRVLVIPHRANKARYSYGAIATENLHGPAPMALHAGRIFEPRFSGSDPRGTCGINTSRSGPPKASATDRQEALSIAMHLCACPAGSMRERGEPDVGARR